MIRDDEDVFYDAEELTESSSCSADGVPHSSPRDNVASLLHRAAFYNDLAMLSLHLRSAPRDVRESLDDQGNSILHVAALRNHQEAAQHILEAGFPPNLKNARGWPAIYEAMTVGHRQVAQTIYHHHLARMKEEVKEKKALLLQTLDELPNYYMELKWELGSSVPGVGLLVRRYAPHDTYKIWKHGSKIRVDGSLMGIEDKGTRLIPEWKRRHFSLVYDGSGGQSQIYFMNRTRKTFYDLTDDRKRLKDLETEELQAQLDSLSDTQHMRLTAKEFGFKPVKGWFGSDMTEKIEGWNTKVYEASGRLVAVKHVKTRLYIPPNTTYEEYLQMSFAEDALQETLDPISLAELQAQEQEDPWEEVEGQQEEEDDEFEGEEDSLTSSGTHLMDNGEGTIHSTSSSASGTDGGLRSRGSSQPSGVRSKPDVEDQTASTSGGMSAMLGNKGRVIRARCWMAEGFPMSLQQLLPLLEVVGQANKHITKVAHFMNKYGDMDRFPIKVQVPIFMTVYALVSFKHFREIVPKDGVDASFFQVPGDYHRKNMEDRMRKGRGMGGQQDELTERDLMDF